MVDGERPASFGVLLRRHRLAAGLTQLALAERAELSARGLAFLERDARHPYPDTVRRLAEVLELAGEERAAFMAASQAEPPAVERIAAGPAGSGETAAPPPMSNLPAPLTSLVGRLQEREAVLVLLESSRLVTLTGTGGIGKTRLALAVAADLVDRYAGGVWLVELAALADAALVPAAVARTLNLEEEAHRPLLATLTDRLKGQQLLLLLDNCEHLVGSCAALVDTLLRGCPEVRVLATSREILRVPGERAYRVPALPLPNLDVPPDADALLAYGAVELFLQRARDRVPDFTLDTHSAGSVIAICAHLDGIPLAIELAAARVGVLSVADIAARLDARFALLTEGLRTGQPRQQTLRAMLDWSYELLDAAEQALLRRLSVFANGWTLEAAAAVCGDGDLWQILDVLARLVNKSLVQVVEHAEERRYTFLETVHLYAREQLRADSDLDGLRDAHLAYYTALAVDVRGRLTGPDQGAWITRLQAELNNVRAALDWACLRGLAATGLRLATAMSKFWDRQSYLHEGRDWLERLLALRESLTLPERARAAWALGQLAYRQGDHVTAAAWLVQSVDLSRRLGDTEGAIDATAQLANVRVAQGDYDQGIAFLEETLASYRARSQHWDIASTLNNLGEALRAQGEFVRAEACYQESLTLYRRLNDLWSAASVLNNLGEMAYQQGDDVRAEALSRESLALNRHLGEQQSTPLIHLNLGNVAARRGDIPAAKDHYLESLAGQRGRGHPAAIAAALVGLATVARLCHNPEEAARLLGAAAAFRAASGAALSDLERAAYEHSVTAVRAALPPADFQTAWDAGGRLDLEAIRAAYGQA